MYGKQLRKYCLIAFVIVWVISASAFGSPHFSNRMLYGVTIDSISPNFSQTLASLNALPEVNIVRLVLDPHMPPKYYLNAAKTLHKSKSILGELLDSSAVKEYSLKQFKQRVNSYFSSELSKYIDIWEIANEVNGEWLGPTKDVVAKMIYAYTKAREYHYKTALTLHYNKNCGVDKAHEMFNWIDNNITPEMREGLDYVFISYYEQDCNKRRPNWPRVFLKLHKIFPDSKIGFGEVGIDKGNLKQRINYLIRYYNMQIYVPNYIGGYFWWYYNEQMRNNYLTNPMWRTLKFVLTMTKLNYRNSAKLPL